MTLHIYEAFNFRYRNYLFLEKMFNQAHTYALVIGSSILADCLLIDACVLIKISPLLILLNIVIAG